MRGETATKAVKAAAERKRKKTQFVKLYVVLGLPDRGLTLRVVQVFT